MDDHLPKGLLDQMHARREATRAKNLFLLSDGTRIDVLDRWKGGFSTPRHVPQLARGFVDLFDGQTHLSHGLAYVTSVKADARVYAFKSVRDPGLSPPVDHVRVSPVPVGLIARN